MGHTPTIQMHGLKETVRGLSKSDKIVRNDIKKITRKWTNVIRDAIKRDMPRTGGPVGKGRRKAGWAKSARKKAGSHHDTKTGSLKNSIRSRAGVDYGVVMGGQEGRTPHFIVNEFGGAVWWHHMGRGVSAQLHDQGAHRSSKENRARFGGNIGHVIPVRLRSPMTGTAQLMNKTGNRFPAGWFFFPNVEKRVPLIFQDFQKEIFNSLRMATYRNKLRGK